MRLLESDYKGLGPEIRLYRVQQKYKLLNRVLRLREQGYLRRSPNTCTCFILGWTNQPLSRARGVNKLPIGLERGPGL
jgi:hypothetical protein